MTGRYTAAEAIQRSRALLGLALAFVNAGEEFDTYALAVRSAHPVISAKAYEVGEKGLWTTWDNARRRVRDNPLQRQETRRDLLGCGPRWLLEGGTAKPAGQIAS